MKRILAIILTLAMAVSVMGMTMVFAEQDTTKTVVLENQEYKSSKTADGTEMYESSHFTVNKNYLQIDISNFADNNANILLWQIDKDAQRVTKELYIGLSDPTVDRAISEIINMEAEFGAYYRGYEYKISVSNSRNYPVNGNIAIYEADSRVDLTSEILGYYDTHATDIFMMTEEQTRARGFLISEGNICNLNGDVIINMTNGLTATGNELAPMFSVSYPKNCNTPFYGKDDMPHIIEGAFPIPLQSENSYNKVGAEYTPIAGYPDLYIEYSSGFPQSINVGVVNKVTNQIEAWCSDIAPGEHAVLPSGTMSNPHELIITSNGTPGDAYISAYITLADNEFEYAPKFFTDISGHWAEEQIRSIAGRGIIDGYPDGTFKPDAKVTRAEFAKIISVAFNLQTKSALNYDDVDKNSWYYPYVEYGDIYIPIYPLPESVGNNIEYQTISEQGLNKFLPDTPAMRMHVAETLVKIRLEKANANILLPPIQTIQAELQTKFIDNDYDNLYAMHGTIPENVKRMFEYTWLANELGIMQGDDDRIFGPYGNLTRAELVTMIDRMLNFRMTPPTSEQIYITNEEIETPKNLDLSNVLELPSSTIKSFFSSFAQGDFESMKKYCTQECIDNYFHTEHGDVFGLKKAELLSADATQTHYDTPPNEYIVFVDLKVEPSEYSSIYPSTDFGFFVHLLRQSDGTYLIHNFSTSGI